MFVQLKNVMQTETNNQTLEAPIVAVTVYTDRARVTRRASVALQAGARDLVLENLPAGVLTDSLRATGRGEVAVKILGVEVREVYLTQSAHEDARAVKDELQAAEDEAAALLREEEVLKQRLTAIENMAQNAARRYAKSLAEGENTLEAAGQLLDFIQAQSATVNAQRAELEKKVRDNRARQEALQNRLQQLHGGGAKIVKQATVAVESSGEGTWELEISYVLYGASWSPLYDVRAQLLPPSNPEEVLEGKVALSYLASIRQNTGEDWNDVALTLSTAKPSLGSLPPKLEPLYVSAYTPPPVPMQTFARTAARGGGSAEEVLAVPMPAAMPAPQARPIEAVSEVAEVKSEGATISFELPRRFSIPADGQPHRGNIGEFELPCQLEYHAVPRRTEWAYLRATIDNESGVSLLPGTANIFRDEMFVGSTNIEAVAPGAEFKIFLGPDEQVKAKRELTKRDVDKSFIGNLRRQTYGYKIEVESLKAYRVVLTVIDQIPVPQHEQIKVKLREAQPQPEQDNLGILKYEMALEPHSKKELVYESLVEYPRDLNVVGLE